ncbi:MAG: single-stranded DNA-binding protein [Selenomonadaceae bacterium]|nr:single-stranded DNA-binding protein [Selenomonadaceae bacterium]
MNTSFYGRLTKDPEVKTSQSGVLYTFFTVATQLPIKDPSGAGRKSLFISCTAFGKQGESVAQYFRKGNRIVVDGIVNDINISHGQNGGEYLNINVNLTNFHIVETKAENEGQNGNFTQQSPQQQPPQQNYGQPPQQNYGQSPMATPNAGAPWGNPPPIQQNNGYANAPY